MMYMYLIQTLYHRIKVFKPQSDTNVHSDMSAQRRQPLYPRSLIRVFVVRMKKFCILDYPKCAQRRFRSDCANAQSDLNLRWEHMSDGTFLDVAVHLFIISVISCSIELKLNGGASRDDDDDRERKFN